jgi:hypothetical protein
MSAGLHRRTAARDVMPAIPLFGCSPAFTSPASVFIPFVLKLTPAPGKLDH